MQSSPSRQRALAALAAALLVQACGGGEAADEALVACEGDPVTLVRPEGWGVESHCPGLAPSYAKLFDDTAVHRFDIEIAPEDYQATMEDLAEKLSGGGPGMLPTEDPIYVPVTVRFDGLTWWQVGMRYKGNSSLRSAWQSGVRKLAFRLNFQKYEDLYPELEDQRFFGFTKMTFSNGFKDRSLIRDKTAGDIFRAGGVPAARGAFARVYVDYGEGPVYFGLYTMIEDPSDEMLDAQFADGSGNLYKPDGPGATFSAYVEEDLEKKTNETERDYSDVRALYDALHADRSDAPAWRAGLEEVFSVREDERSSQSFLRYLALNQAMVNWDSYGFMSHNYYLYGDPGDAGRLVWCVWDLNEAMLEREVQGIDAGTVMLDEIDQGWPLIRYLLDDPVYREIYRAELENALQGAFDVDEVRARLDANHALIEQFVVGSDGEVAPYTFLKSGEEFESSLLSGENALQPHVEARHAAVAEALGS